MKLNQLLFFSFAAALATSFAHASYASVKDEPVGNGSGPGAGAAPAAGGNSEGGSTASITFAELKERCLHPDQFNTQRAPQKILVQCTERTLDYVPASAAQIPLQGARTVVTSVMTDKFHIAASAVDLPVPAKGGNCLSYKEVERAFTFEQPLSCEQLLGLKEDISNFCVGSIDHAKGSNSKLVETRETGRLIDGCGGRGVPYPSWGGKDGQGGKGGQGGEHGDDGNHSTGNNNGASEGGQGGKDGKY